MRAMMASRLPPSAGVSCFGVAGAAARGAGVTVSTFGVSFGSGYWNGRGAGVPATRGRAHLRVLLHAPQPAHLPCRAVADRISRPRVETHDAQNSPPPLLPSP